MTAAEATVNQDGVIIMIASSSDGIGGDHFYHQLADERDINKTMDIFLKRGRNETVPDQWQTQIMLRILMRAKIIYISEMPDDMVKKMHMIPARSLDEAIKKAKEILGRETVKITAIPDGVSVVVQK
jgi:nickel-dependent lactate racemase